MADPERRRRRLRHHPSGDVPAGRTGSGHGSPPDRAGSVPVTGADADAVAGQSVRTSGVHDPVPEPTGPRRRPGPEPAAGPVAEDRENERGLRGLVGSGSSQLSLGAALRARDAARPSEEDLAEAEQGLVVVRRNWVPREELPRPDRG